MRCRFDVLALVAPVLAGVGVAWSLRSWAEDPVPAAAPATAPLSFATPEEAAAAYVDALARNDDDRLLALLGSSDLVRDGRAEVVVKRRAAIAEAARERLDLDRRREAHGTIVVRVGASSHPLAVPLSKDPRGWHLDAVAGLERRRARRVGRNELAAIATCRALVDAEFDYAAVDRDGAGPAYARRLVSSEGTRDGLWWDDRATPDDPSPLAVRLDRIEHVVADSEAALPFGGYAWRVLLAQGESAPGGVRDWVVGERLVAGFAWIGAPVRYRETGVKTFLVGPDGEVRERDLGENSLAIASAMDVFDPDETWTRVEDAGDDDPEDGVASGADSELR